jgi:hypothetical protein
MRNDLEMITTGQTGNETDALDSIAPYMAPLCGIMVILLAVMVFILIGFIYVFTGRSEFGQKQARNTEIGLGLLIGGFILALIGSLVVTFSQSDSQNNSLIGVNVAVTIITSFLYGFGFLFLLKQQLDPQGINYLKMGVILFILVNFVNMGFALSMNTDNGIIYGLIFIAVISIPWAIFAFSFYRSWKLMQWGVIKPEVPIYPSFDPNMPITSGGKPNACPSCGFIIGTEVTECPKCGFYLRDH